MIAGLRGDAISTSLADEQGVAIARRMQRATPQLPALVAARTTHVAKSLGAPDRGFTQVVVLGAGLDAKSMRFAGAAQRWFLCDLPDMLQYRAERYNALGYADRHCVHVAIDFRRGGWAQQIIDAGFNPGAPALVILEGVSMYLPAAELRATADEIRKLCNNVESRWWFDHVTREAFTLEQPEVLSFLSNMARLGEPFITGISNPAQILGEDSWRLAHSSPHFGSHEHVAELGCL
jgi:methyltransferase (TIGR00027 family)